MRRLLHRLLGWLRPSRAERYVRHMRRGRWQGKPGPAPVVDSNGLRSGQHRLNGYRADDPER